MEPFLAPGFAGNPSSIHAEGRRARAAVDAARDRIAALLGPGVKPGEIIFTSGGTESNNLALRGLVRAAPARSGARHLIVAATEHHAVLEAAQALARQGIELTILPVDAAGRADPLELERSLRPETALVSVMTANNETGTLQPVAELAEICARRGVLFHTDAAQSAGKEALPTATEAAPHLSALSLAGHKFGGPPGIGLLWRCAGACRWKRGFHGGSQENTRRPGTENVAGIVGLAEALARAEMAREAERPRQLAMTERLWEGLRDLPGARRNTPSGRGAPGGQHPQRQLRRGGPGRRGAAHRPRPGGSGRLQRIGLPGRLDPALARPAGHGCARGGGAGHRPLLHRERDHLRPGGGGPEADAAGRPAPGGPGLRPIDLAFFSLGDCEAARFSP